MAVAIKVDQAGAPPGVAGQAREDLVTGLPVTLTSTGGPFLRYAWNVVHRPIDILIPARSSCALATANAASSILQPIDVAGTHLVEVSVDSGAGLGAGVGDVARITFYAGPTLAIDPRQLPRRKPAAFEQLQHNVPDSLDPTGNPDGWSREWYRWFASLEAVIPGKGWAGGRVRLTGSAATLTRGYNIASVARTGAGHVHIVFSTAMPDVNYGVLATPIITGISPSIRCTFAIENIATTDFDLVTVDEVTGSPDDGFDFTFRVELGV